MQRITRDLIPHFCTQLLAIPLIFFALTLVSSPQAFGGIITEVETIVVTGTVTQTVETKMATGNATVTPPGGPAMTQNMPPTGGSIKVVVPLSAFAGATVDLATQRKSTAWGYVSDSGFTANASADIHKTKTTTSITTSTIITRVRTRLDPFETIDAFFGPGVNGTTNFNLSLTDNNSGTPLFNSTTLLTSSSPDVVQDNTGSLTWNRAPGLFDGDEGDLSGLPNQFSNNRWVLAPFSLTFDIPATLNPGQSYNQDITGLVSSSGTTTGGSGVIGISDRTVPEPATWLVLGTGLIMLLGYRWRNKQQPA